MDKFQFILSIGVGLVILYIGITVEVLELIGIGTGSLLSTIYFNRSTLFKSQHQESDILDD